jgi:hypothetical protein
MQGVAVFDEHTPHATYESALSTYSPQLFSCILWILA